MPSLHVGWSLLVGVAIARSIGGPGAYPLAVAVPSAMAFAVVATANHYIADVVVGSAMAGLAFLLPAVAERVTARQRPVSGHPAPAAQERAR